MFRIAFVVFASIACVGCSKVPPSKPLSAEEQQKLKEAIAEIDNNLYGSSDGFIPHKVYPRSSVIINKYRPPSLKPNRTTSKIRTPSTISVPSLRRKKQNLENSLAMYKNSIVREQKQIQGWKNAISMEYRQSRKRINDINNAISDKNMRKLNYKARQYAKKTAFEKQKSLRRSAGSHTSSLRKQIEISERKIRKIRKEVNRLRLEISNTETEIRRAGG